MILLYCDRIVRNVCFSRISVRSFSMYDNDFKRHRKRNSSCSLQSCQHIEKSRHQSKFYLFSCDGKILRKNINLFGFQQSIVEDFNTVVKYFLPGWQIKSLVYRTMCHFSEDIADVAKYEEISDETLESISEYFEELLDSEKNFPDADVSLSAGVLTVYLSDKSGSYVINRQTPNRQIWLSSPLSGPKRYDWIDGHWVYKHDHVSLHELLSKEMSLLLKSQVDFTKCSYGTSNKTLYFAQTPDNYLTDLGWFGKVQSILTKRKTITSVKLPVHRKVETHHRLACKEDIDKKIYNSNFDLKLEHCFLDNLSQQISCKIFMSTP